MATRSWPLMSCQMDFTAGPPGIPGASAVDVFAPASPTALRAFSTSRGRQYELGTVQAGTLAMDLTDSKEYLNPVNTGSPWNSGANSLLPYRAVQLSAWWNTATKDVTGNMLNSTNLVSGSNTIHYDPSFESGTGGWFGIVGAPALTTSTLHHLDGAQSLRCTFNAGTDQIVLSGPSVIPGLTYTASLSVWVPTGASVTFTFANNAAGFPAIGSATSTVTNNWQRLVVTGVPTSSFVVFLVNLTTGTPPVQMWIDQTQLELGGSFTSFTTVGPTCFDVFTGFIERYPQAWDLAGSRGRKPLAAVDALSPLSRTIISQSYAATVLADSPAVFIPYDDDSFPQTVKRITGGQPVIPYQQLGSQSASLSFGGDSFLDGSKAVSLSQQNTDPVTLQTDTTQVTYLGTRQGSLTMSPAASTIEVWVKLSAGQAYLGAATMDFGESTVGEPAGPNHYWGWYSSFGHLVFRYADPNGGTVTLLGFNPAAPWNGYPDGKWHYLNIILSGPGNIGNTIDTRYGSFVPLSSSPSTALGLTNFFVNATSYFGDPISNIAVANMAIYPSVLSAAQSAAHYQRGIGYLGEKSGTRALRLLTQYWSTNVVTDTGVTSMAADFGYNGRAMLDVLQEIADTEGGLVWVDAAGLVHQDSRETRYTATTSATAQFVFGENTAGGELPYDTLTYDYDPTYVYSQANITSGGTGTQLAPVINATSQTAYGQRILSKTLQSAVDWDAQQAAQFYVQRYAKPAGAPGTAIPPRISGMTINPAANPNLWAAALTLDIRMRVTVKRRTSAGVTISGDYYIEQVNHAVNGDAATWSVAYQLSPVFVSQPWILGDATKGVLGSTTVCVY